MMHALQEHQHQRLTEPTSGPPSTSPGAWTVAGSAIVPASVIATTVPELQCRNSNTTTSPRDDNDDDDDDVLNDESDVTWKEIADPATTFSIKECSNRQLEGAVILHSSNSNTGGVCGPRLVRQRTLTIMICCCC
jgi:hypothetical protein